MRSAILALLALSASVRASTFDLSSLPWTLRNLNGSIVVPGKVPSQAHLDLFAAGVITDPILGINDYTQRWVAADTWTYTADITSFVKAQSQLKVNANNSKTLLVFYGLDTVANITLCGQPVAWVNNQFRQFVFDVSSITSGPIGANKNLTITFEPAYAYGLNVSALPEIQPGKPPPPATVEFIYPGARQYVRKTQSDFGWDWSPAFLPVGIYKPASFVTLSSATQLVSLTSPAVFIEETSIDIYKVGQNQAVVPNESANWVVNVTLAIRSAEQFLTPTITLAIGELLISSGPLSVGAIQAKTDDVTWVSVQWQIPDHIPKRWYPHDMATGPRLYDLTALLHLGNSVVTVTKRTGFRTVQLLQDTYTSAEVATGITPGDRFGFKINGIEFYSKGTNVVPVDAFYSRVNPNKARWLLESAVKSGQNMIRVWGGGIYQPSDSTTAGGLYDFYSICDEIGLMVWSELSFSDSLYQTTPFLVENYDYEVRSQVRRINRHPSNIHWAAGNEVEVILLLGYTDPNFGPEVLNYLPAFLELFQDILHNFVLSETRAIPYSPCSFTRGVLSLDPYQVRVYEQLDFTNLFSNLFGTFEYYNYDASQSFDLDMYSSSRYMVEFGINSMPSIYSWQEAITSPADLTFDSLPVVSRQHRPPPGNLTWPNPNAPEGQAALLQAINLWVPAVTKTNAKDKFVQQCYSTQVYQALFMASEISWYRLGAGKPEQSRGVVVWQLNDVWQAPSWSSIEYSGRWKILQYELARAFKPVVINPFYYPNNQTLEVYVSSDAGQAVAGSAKLAWYDWHGKVVNVTTKPFTVNNFQNTPIFKASGLSNILPGTAAAEDVWLYMTITAHYQGKTVTHERTFTVNSLASSHLVNPQIQVTRSSALIFKLSAKGGVAPWTWIEHPADTIGYFVDFVTGELLNGFYLIPGQDRTVKFIVNAATSKAVPKAADFVVRSVWDNNV